MHRLLAVVLVSGCVPTSFTYSPMSARGPVAKPEGCAFDVLTMPPTKGYEEVGTLSFYNGEEPTTPEGFKKVVAKQVCEVGGDAVIAISNSAGQLTKGTVIKFAPEPKK